MEWVIGNNQWPNWQIIIVTGACRSGKTLLCRLLSTLENVEWIEEPYGLLQLPSLHEVGLIDDHTYETFFISQIKELCIENVLLRNGNFRPNDLSSIKGFKEDAEIRYRLEEIEGRGEAVKKILESNKIFLVDIPQLGDEVLYLLNRFQGLDILEVTRHPNTLAKAVSEKSWFSRERLITPQDQTLFYRLKYKNETYYLPWWVKTKDAENFVNAKEYEKGIYYWFQMYKSIGDRENHRHMTHIRFEDLISSPSRILDQFCSDYKKRKTEMTNKQVEYILNISIENIDMCQSVSCNEDVRELAAKMQYHF